MDARHGLRRLSSGFLLGTTLTAMLLGHHYLTAPAMSIEPLKRIVALMAMGPPGRAACSPGSASGRRRPATLGAGAYARTF